MAIDPSGRGRNETGYSVVKMCHGNLFLSASGGYTGGFERETLIKLATTAKEQKVNEIVIESNFGDGMYQELFKPVLKKIYPCRVTEVRNSIQKERRIIDVLEPVMNQHRLIVDPAVIRKDARETEQVHNMLFWQMTRMTKEQGAIAQDDRIDSLCEAVSYWTDKMGQEQDDATEEWKELELRESLNGFLAHVMGLGGRPKPLSWIKC